MKGNLVLCLRENEDELRYNFDVDAEEDEYTVGITIDNLNESYSSLESNPDDLKMYIENMLYFIDDDELIERELCEQCMNNVQNLIKDAESITLMFELEDCKKYIDANPELRNKKIILGNVPDLTLDIIEKIKSIFGNTAPFLYIKMKENRNIISFDEYCDTIKTIDSIASEIDKLNLSTLEKIMYAYDIVRNKLYVQEENNEKDYVSRDLSSSLLGNKIVCLGYARIFKTILERLGIESFITHLNNIVPEENGHARNEVYVKDDKYGIDGVYFFDPTWDRKREEDNNNYLLSYRFFCIPKSKMDTYDGGEIYDKAFPYFDSKLADEFMETDLSDLSPDLVRSINHMSLVLNGRHLINPIGLPPYSVAMFKPDKDKVYQELKPLVEKYSSPIPADVFLEVLYNVRKLEYYKNSETYPFNLYDFYKTVVYSKWEFPSTPEKNFLRMFADKKMMNKITASEVKQYSNKSELEKRIEQVRLTKTLRLALDKRMDEKCK